MGKHRGGFVKGSEETRNLAKIGNKLRNNGKRSTLKLKKVFHQLKGGWGPGQTYWSIIEELKDMDAFVEHKEMYRDDESKEKSSNSLPQECQTLKQGPVCYWI